MTEVEELRAEVERNIASIKSLVDNAEVVAKNMMTLFDQTDILSERLKAAENRISLLEESLVAMTSTRH